MAMLKTDALLCSLACLTLTLRWLRVQRVSPRAAVCVLPLTSATIEHRVWFLWILCCLAAGRLDSQLLPTSKTSTGTLLTFSKNTGELMTYKPDCLLHVGLAHPYTPAAISSHPRCLFMPPCVSTFNHEQKFLHVKNSAVLTSGFLQRNT